MSADDLDVLFEAKRTSEIGNTYFLKAKEFTEQEEIQIKSSYMNP